VARANVTVGNAAMATVRLGLLTFMGASTEAGRSVRSAPIESARLFLTRLTCFARKWLC
jgi:hypothetical protein